MGREKKLKEEDNIGTTVIDDYITVTYNENEREEKIYYRNE